MVIVFPESLRLKNWVSGLRQPVRSLSSVLLNPSLAGSLMETLTLVIPFFCQASLRNSGLLLSMAEACWATGVSTLSDYVRLSVKRKCPLSRLPC